MTPSLTLLLAHFKCHLLENYSIQGNGSIRSRPGSPRRRWRARWRRWLKRRWGNSTTSSFLIFGNIMHFSVGDSYCGQWPLGPTPKIWDHPRCRCWIFLRWYPKSGDFNWEEGSSIMAKLFCARGAAQTGWPGWSQRCNASKWHNQASCASVSARRGCSSKPQGEAAEADWHALQQVGGAFILP